MRRNGGIIGLNNNPTSNQASGIWRLRHIYDSVLINEWPSFVVSLYSFTNATFTSGGSTGRFGPTFNQAISGLSGPEVNDWANNTSFFNVSDGIQLWTVPVTGDYNIRAVGAAGGDKGDFTNQGGYGSDVMTTLSLQGGEVLSIVIGQQGGRSLSSSSSGGGGGGGATWIYKDSSSPIVVAGGGGGIGAGNAERNPGNDSGWENSNWNTTQLIFDISSGSPTYTDRRGNGEGGYSYGAVSGPDYDSGGGAGWLSNGSDGVQFPGTMGGNNLNNTQPWVGGNYDASRDPYIAIGGFGGGGAASDGGGGGGGYTGGNGGRWGGGLASGGGSGSSYVISNIETSISNAPFKGNGLVEITKL